jgi:hypothetical protein
MTTETLIHRGGCHCGLVRFEADGPAHLDVLDCNCSMCSKTGFLHWIVPLSRFRLLSGADRLVTYTFGTGVARHMFCGVCGIKAFYVPRSNPDGMDINVRCLDDDPRRTLTIEPFDGRNWEQSGAALAHLSTES